jgi:hypothetical protein
MGSGGIISATQPTAVMSTTVDIEMTGRSVTLDMHSDPVDVYVGRSSGVTEALAIDWNGGTNAVRCVIRITNGVPQLIARMVENDIDVGSPVINLPTNTKSLRIGMLSDGRSVWHQYSTDKTTFLPIAPVKLFPTFVCTGVPAQWTWQCQLQSGTPTSLTTAVSSRIYGSTQVTPTPSSGTPVKSDAWRSFAGTANAYVSMNSDAGIITEAALTNDTDGIWFAAEVKRTVPTGGAAAPLDVLMGIQRDATTAHRFLLIQASSDTQANVVQFYDQDSGGWGDPTVKVPADGDAYFVLGHRTKTGLITTHAINTRTGVAQHSASPPTVAVGTTATTAPRIILGASNEVTTTRVSHGQFSVWGIGTGPAPTNAQVEAALYKLSDGTSVVTRQGLMAIPGFEHGFEANFPKATITDIATTGTVTQFAESGSTAVQDTGNVPYSAANGDSTPPTSTFVPQPTLTVTNVGRNAGNTAATAHLHTDVPTAITGPPSFTPNATPIAFFWATQPTGPWTQIGTWGTATDVDYTWAFDTQRYFASQWRDNAGAASVMTVLPSSGATGYIVSSIATLPNPPLNLAATQSGTNVVLTWTPDVSGAAITGFNVYQNSVRITASPLAASATSYTVVNGASVPNLWSVTALNSSVESSQDSNTTLLAAGGVAYRRPSSDVSVVGFVPSTSGSLYVTQNDSIGWTADPPTVDPASVGDNQVMATAGGGSSVAFGFDPLVLPGGLTLGACMLWAHCYTRPNVTGTISYRLGTTGAETVAINVSDSTLQWRSASIPAAVAGDPSLQIVFRSSSAGVSTGSDTFWSDAMLIRAAIQNTPISPPKTPSGLSLTATTLNATNPALVNVTANWISNTETNLGTPAYLLYTGPTVAGPWTPKATANFPTTSLALTALTPGTYVGIAAQDNRTPPNISSVSAGVVVSALAPTTPILTAVRATSTSVQVNLTATAGTGPAVTGWKFFRDGVALNAVAQASSSFTDTADALSHAYTVVASNAAGSSPTSAQATVPAAATVTLPAITAPTGVTPIAGANYGEEYIYIDVPPANQLIEGFDLYLKLTADSVFPSSPEYSGPGVAVTQGGTQKILFDLTGLLPGSSYNYQLQAWRNE